MVVFGHEADFAAVRRVVVVVVARLLDAGGRRVGTVEQGRHKFRNQTQAKAQLENEHKRTENEVFKLAQPNSKA